MLSTELTADGVAVSVLLDVLEVEGFQEQLASLDRQSLGSHEFEVLVSGSGLPGETLTALQRVAAHRPNLRVTTSSRDALLSECRGRYVLRLRPTETLFPSALEQLRDYAHQHECAAVLGRVVQESRPVAEELWTDRVLDADGASAGPDRVLLARRSLTSLDAEGGLAVGTGRVGVQAAHPSALRRSSTVVAAAPAVPLTSASWAEGRLTLTMSVPATATGSEPRALLLLRQIDTLDTRLVPAQVATTTDPEGGSLTAEAIVEPLTVTGVGGRPGLGVWLVELQLIEADDATAVVHPVRWSPCPAALVTGVPIVPASVSEAFALDVGAETYPVVGAVDPADATVSESAAGSRLVIGVPGVHVHETEALEGLLGLDKLLLPARLVPAGAGAQIEAMVSGVAATPALSAQFGGGRLHRLGVSLRIDGLGQMTVVPTPPPAKPAAKKAPAKKAPAKKVSPSTAATKASKPKPKPKPPPRQGLIAAVRRAVPTPLEPVVLRIAKVKVARRLYRSITH